MPAKKILFLLVLCIGLWRCDGDDDNHGTLKLVNVFIGPDEISLTAPFSNGQPLDRSITLVFSQPVNTTSAASSISLLKDGNAVNAHINFLSQNKSVTIQPVGVLQSNSTYTINISNNLQGANGESFAGMEINFTTALDDLEIVSVAVGQNNVDASTRVTDVPLNLGMTINFSAPVTENEIKAATTLSGSNVPSLLFSLSNENKTVTITTASTLKYLTKYQFKISSTLKGALGQSFSEYQKTLYTTVDPTPKFPVISDDALLTLVQQQTFKYFWDFAHPTSGLARERNTSGDIVTTGGSGFGIMSIIVGIERNFITRQQGIERLDKILDFLETADRFHGVWPHWLNGNTGKVQPFSANDNGGDLVETSFLMQGLITFRQYLNSSDPTEQQLISRINALWNTVEWDWYTQGGQNVLYWHWSPDKAWIMNHQIKGYNEALITYVLAASSTTHSINASVYHQGWASSGAIKNGKTFYGTTLPLGFDYGGPLFFAHYSFLGLDPRNLSDTYGNYWTQNVNHSKINHAYSAANPKKFVGYSDESWGLTASDNQSGYSAHSPTNDLGVITPTAALSSFPYTPTESMKALKFFYYTIGDRLWGQYGFYDAYNFTESWVASSYLAIDQGPIIVMIENHRTGLLWNLFMSAPEVQAGLDKLSFTY
jgi:hypothetical protein